MVGFVVLVSCAAAALPARLSRDGLRFQVGHALCLCEMWAGEQGWHVLDDHTIGSMLLATFTISDVVLHIWYRRV
jgi:hypothetical protein